MQYNSKILAVVNQKGGVGKTTLTAILAEYAAIKLNQKVLIVDLDMQCNSTDNWVGMEFAPDSPGGQLPPKNPHYEAGAPFNERSTIADIFDGKGVLPHDTFLSSDALEGNVEILAGHPAKFDELSSGKGYNGNIAIKIAEFLHLPDLANEYDLIIIDTAPSRSPLFRAALRSATHVVIPFEPEENSLQGINAMVQAINSENLVRPQATEGIVVVGFCPNKVMEKTKIHGSTLRAVRDSLGDALFPDGVFLSRSITVPERTVKGVAPKSIYDLPESNTARADAVKVSEYILSKI